MKTAQVNEIWPSQPLKVFIKYLRPLRVLRVRTVK
jgi:hypothetical protein